MTKSQIKIKISKLARGLGRFSIDDILIITDIEKQKIQDVLLELERESIIKRIGESKYLYTKLKKLNSIQEKNTPPVIPLFNEEEELAIYQKAKPKIRQNIYKYICQAPNLWSKVKVSFCGFFSGITFAIGAGGA